MPSGVRRIIDPNVWLFFFLPPLDGYGQEDEVTNRFTTGKAEILRLVFLTFVYGTTAVATSVAWLAYLPLGIVYFAALGHRRIVDSLLKDDAEGGAAAGAKLKRSSFDRTRGIGQPNSIQQVLHVAFSFAKQIASFVAWGAVGLATGLLVSLMLCIWNGAYMVLMRLVVSLGSVLLGFRHMLRPDSRRYRGADVHASTFVLPLTDGRAEAEVEAALGLSAFGRKPSPLEFAFTAKQVRHLRQWFNYGLAAEHTMTDFAHAYLYA